MLTQNELKQQLHYDPETGVFTRLVSNSPKAVVGEMAGYISVNYKDPQANKYIRINVFAKKYGAHRLAWLYMTGSFPKNHIDHINHDGTDNRWINLRDVTPNENFRNQRMPCNNKSGLVGVRWDKNANSWKSTIDIRRTKTHLGYFKSIFDAACARKNAEIKHNFHPNHGRRLDHEPNP